jgi:hypothetical protein
MAIPFTRISEDIMSTTLHPGEVSAAESTALSLLFSRFVAGEISDAAWIQMMAALDEGDTNAEERSALVNFLSDACHDLGPDAVEIPDQDDVEDFVCLMRAA